MNFPDLMTMLINVGQTIPAIIMLMQVIVGFIALYITGAGLLELWGATNDQNSKFLSSQRSYSVSSAIISLFIGGILLSLSTLEFVGVLSRTFSGDHATARVMASAMSYSGNDSSASDKAQVATIAILALLQAVGFIALTKGFLTINRYYKQQGNASLSTSIIWIVGGTLAWNFRWFAQTLNNTIGFDIIRLFTAL